MSNCKNDCCGGYDYGYGYGRDYGYGNYNYNGNNPNCDVCYRIGYEECAREAFRGKLDAERKILNDYRVY